MMESGKRPGLFTSISGKKSFCRFPESGKEGVK
jgi:hypothetical protein